MADFSIPFASNGSIRYPSSSELDTGIPCGPVDRSLLNALFLQFSSEIGEVIDYAGITPQTNTRHTLLREAIEALIAAATGGSGDYVLMAQARARLPIFPETLTSDGKIVITSPSTGTVRVPGGSDFLHRGIYSVTTAETDFATTASKTYHLRWNPTDGFSLEDLSDSGYNPSTLAETDASFDSVYDDMLVARVVTNSSNVATITNLVNFNRLAYHEGQLGTNFFLSGQNFASAEFSFVYDWARTPTNKAFSFTCQGSAVQVGDHDFLLEEYGLTLAWWNANIVPSYTPRLTDFPATRYNSQFRYMVDSATSIGLTGTFSA